MPTVHNDVPSKQSWIVQSFDCQFVPSDLLFFVIVDDDGIVCFVLASRAVFRGSRVAGDSRTDVSGEVLAVRLRMPRTGVNKSDEQ